MMKNYSEDLNILYSEEYETYRKTVDLKDLTPLEKALWFRLICGEPAAEYSKVALQWYRTLPYEKNKIAIEDYKGKIANSQSFYADIMTGWWVPFAKTFTLGGEKITKKTEEKLKEEIKQQTDWNTWLKTFLERLKKENESVINNKKFMDAFNEFLEVVYTVGNTIPAPYVTLYGNNLDAWDAKLEIIKGSTKGCSAPEKAWLDYINKYCVFDSFDDKFEDFIKQNYLEMYWDKREKQIKFFWSAESDVHNHRPQTLDDWATYFTNVTECINKRNDVIQKRYNEEIKKQKGDE